jgi:drug/metabolite transporter (DMT)-like permease
MPYSRVALIAAASCAVFSAFSPLFAARSAAEQEYSRIAAVLAAELAKVIFSIAGLLYTEKPRLAVGKLRQLSSRIWLLFCVPAVLTLASNALFSVAENRVSISASLVVSSLKIPFAALCSRFLLRQRISAPQWIALLTLLLGLLEAGWVAEPADDPTSTLAGVLTTGLIAFSTGLTGAFTEYLLKNLDITVFHGTLLLSCWGCALNAGWLVLHDFVFLLQHGLNPFAGFDTSVSCCVASAALSGVLVAFVLKDGDNLLRAFATTCSVPIATFLAWPFLSDVPIASEILGSLSILAATAAFLSAPASSTAQQQATHGTSLQMRSPQMLAASSFPPAGDPLSLVSVAVTPLPSTVSGGALDTRSRQVSFELAQPLLSPSPHCEGAEAVELPLSTPTASSRQFDQSREREAGRGAASKLIVPSSPPQEPSAPSIDSDDGWNLGDAPVALQAQPSASQARTEHKGKKAD